MLAVVCINIYVYTNIIMKMDFLELFSPLARVFFLSDMTHTRLLRRAAAGSLVFCCGEPASSVVGAGFGATLSGVPVCAVLRPWVLVLLPREPCVVR